MMEYTYRLDFEDETFEVTTIIAGSLVEADQIARRDPEVRFTTCLGTFDPTPQTYLAGYAA